MDMPTRDVEEIPQVRALLDSSQTRSSESDPMSLNIEAPTGLGEQAESQLHSIFETLDDVMISVMKEGFMSSGRPQYAPPVIDPTWLTELTPERYHLLTASLSAWKTYSEELINTLECGIEECDNELKLLGPAIRKNVRLTAKANEERKPNEDAIKDEVLTNPRYIQLTQRRQVLVQKKKIVEPYAARYGRDLRILSRALEMRRQELGFGGQGDAGNGPRREW